MRDAELPDVPVGRMREIFAAVAGIQPDFARQVVVQTELGERRVARGQ